MPSSQSPVRPLHVVITETRSLWREALRVVIERLDPDITVEEVPVPDESWPSGSPRTAISGWS